MKKKDKQSARIGKSRPSLLVIRVCVISSIGFGSANGARTEESKTRSRSIPAFIQTAQPQNINRQGSTAAVGDDNEGDLPAFAEGLISHDEYLRLRNEH